MFQQIFFSDFQIRGLESAPASVDAPTTTAQYHEGRMTHPVPAQVEFVRSSRKLSTGFLCFSLGYKFSEVYIYGTYADTKLERITITNERKTHQLAFQY